MKIEVNKNELERALIALGKLISRMSPVPEHKAGRMQGWQGLFQHPFSV
jgi:hypothetical protein